MGDAHKLTLKKRVSATTVLALRFLLINNCSSCALTRSASITLKMHLYDLIWGFLLEISKQRSVAPCASAKFATFIKVLLSKQAILVEAIHTKKFLSESTQGYFATTYSPVRPAFWSISNFQSSPSSRSHKGLVGSSWLLSEEVSL